MPVTSDPLNLVIRFLKEESAAPLIEYALIGSLIAVVAGLFVMAFNKNYWLH